MNIVLRGLCALMLMAAALLPEPSEAAEAADETLRSCEACHALKRPQSVTLRDRIDRKGPDLFYAGDKYRRDWLAGWLENPKRLWPAGLFFARHTKVTDEGDVIDAGSLAPHPKLPASQAATVADRLMTLHGPETVEAKRYQPKGVPKRMAVMNFRKFKGCGACHQDQPGYGGVSGPELYTAFRRLQPAYIAAYIRDPLARDAKSLMPRRQLVDTEIHKLIDYLKLLAEETS